MRHSLSKFKIVVTIVLLLLCFVDVKSNEQQTNNLNYSAETDSTSENSQKKELIESITCATDSLQKITAYYNYGTFLDDHEAFEPAVSQLNNALRIANTISNHEIITKITNYLGGMYWSSGDCETSTSYFEQALEHAKLSENDDLIAMVKMNLSGNYNSSGDANKAIEYSLAALAIKEKNNNLDGICFDYVTVGEIFQNIGNIEKWKLYIQKAYDLKDNKTCAKMTDLVMIYNNLGTIAEAEKEYKQALAYYDTMMFVSETNDYYEGIGISRLNSALIYQLLGKPGKALELTTESMQFLGDVPYFIMAVNNVKAELLKELGRNSEALDLATLTLNNEELDYYPSLKQQCLGLLYNLNFQLGNYQQAFNWNDTLKVYENKLREEENLKAVEELETKYQTEKKEQQIELLQAENRIKHQEFIASIAITVAVILILIIGILLYLKTRKQNQVHQLLLRQQLLRSQMNPHFLFNALGSIQNFMYKNETKKAAAYLGNFASLTRSILEHSAEEFVPLSAEIETLHNYVKLEQMRVKSNFDYKIEYDEDLDTEFIKIPPMLIQPFVENAIKHGLKNLDYPGLLTIQIYEIDDELQIKVTDNGHGINTAKTSDEKAKTHRSMSMQIFKERRDILSHRFKKDISFELIDRNEQNEREKGTEVLIVIPV